MTMACILTGVTTPAAAQDWTPQQKLMAKRAAELDAYRKIAERVLGLQIRGDSSVRDFVGESDDISAAMDHFIKGIRLSDPRYYDDGSCEVDAEVTIERVITEVKKIYDEVYKGGRWKKEEFEDIRKRTERKVLRETGAGAVRPESVIPDPKDQPIVAPIVTGRPIRTALPDIYKQFPPNERLKAKRAAELDAYRKLLERIYGLQISAGTKVKDFVTETDQIRASTEGELKGVRTVGVRYAPDGVVEVEMAITIERVITTVKRVYDEKYQGGRWKKEYFDDIRKHTERKVITVIGTGALDTRGAAGDSTRDSGNTRVIEGDEVIVVE
jgi:hypothetical protein